MNRYVTCTTCLAKGGDPKPNRLLLHTCELAYLDHHSRVECTPAWGPSHLTPLSSLLPELTFSPFSYASPDSSLPSSSHNLSHEVLKFDNESVEIIEELGSGAYGVVYKAKMGKDKEGKEGEIVAVKRLENVHKDGTATDSMRSVEKLNMFLEFWHEASILSYVHYLLLLFGMFLTLNRKLDHECITGLKGVCFEPLSMALEYIDGPSLYSFVNDRSRPISWKLVLKIAKDLARALNYMHSQTPPIIHRDLKSPNGTKNY